MIVSEGCLPSPSLNSENLNDYSVVTSLYPFISSTEALTPRPDFHDSSHRKSGQHRQWRLEVWTAV